MDPTRRELFAAPLAGLPQDSLAERIDELTKLVAALSLKLTEADERLSWLSRASPPVGTVAAFAGPWPPKRADGATWAEADLGWLLCDGRPWDDPTLAPIPRARLLELAAVLDRTRSGTTAPIPQESGGHTAPPPPRTGGTGGRPHGTGSRAVSATRVRNTGGRRPNPPASRSRTPRGSTRPGSSTPGGSTAP